MASRSIKLGVLVPSSNTALEPLTTAIVSSIPNASVHYSRFPVTEISLSSNALSQFDDSKIIEAANLLADAKVDVIGWSGTSAGWLGLDADHRLCKKIQEGTGIRTTTSVIGLTKILDSLSLERGIKSQFGLVTPYLDDVQQKVTETFGKAGYEVIAESHLNRKVNVEFANITEDELDDQVEEVVSKMDNESVKIVSTFCTNLRAAQRVAHWEEKYAGLIVADTVSTVVWDMLRILGADMSSITQWGAVFKVGGVSPEDVQEGASIVLPLNRVDHVTSTKNMVAKGRAKLDQINKTAA